MTGSLKVTVTVKGSEFKTCKTLEVIVVSGLAVSTSEGLSIPTRIGRLALPIGC